MRAKKSNRSAVIGAAALVAVTANAQEASPNATSTPEGARSVEEIIVSGSRLPANLRTMPGSVTVLDEEVLEQQLAVTSDLGAVLSYTVPGYGTSMGNAGTSNFGQTLRGRSVLVLIDGVQVSTPLRDGQRDLRAIDGATIERVEVLRGSSALYGNGGGGGVVNYITKGPGQGPLKITTDLSTSFSLTHFSDSLRPSVTAGGRGSTESGWDYNFTGTYESIDAFFDADGDRMPSFDDGGLTGSERRSAFAKVGYAWGDRRLQASMLWYHQEADAREITVGGNFRTGAKATAARLDAPLGAPPGTENLMANFVFTDTNVWGSGLRAQAFYQDYDNTFTYSMTWPATPGGPANTGGNSKILGEKSGLRLDVTSPLSWLLDDAQLLWGIDVVNDKTQQLVEPGGRVWIPEMDQDTVALFAQFELPVTDRIAVNGGARYEDIGVDIGSYRTLFTDLAIQGGALDYSETTFNLGTTLRVTDAIDVFASFSQGFSLADLGRILRGARRADTVQGLQPEAQIQDKWELGVRGDWHSVRASLAVFYNESDLGITLVTDPDNPFRSIVLRQAEEIYGAEATLDVELDEWRFGSTASWLEGKRDANGDGDPETYLNGVRIPPLKLTAYVEHSLLSTGLIRLQALYSGSRDRFPGSTQFFEGDVSSFLVVDLLAQFVLGPGKFSVGVNNLLNEDYFSNFSEQFNYDLNYIAAEGATMSLKYSLQF